VESSLVFLALPQRLAYQRQHLVIDLDSAQDICEAVFENLLSGEWLGALPFVAGAMVVDVAFLLDLRDEGAGTMSALNPAGESKVMLDLAIVPCIPAVHHPLHALP
jgi:hypothetical protein